MSPPLEDTVIWRNDEDWVHFQKHGPEMGIPTVAAYDASARATIRLGKEFTYRDPDLGIPRVGFFTLGNGKFTALDQTRSRIVTHFAPYGGERYVRDKLPESTYSR